MPPAKKTPAKRRPKEEDVGAIRVPERFQEVVGDLAGIPLLKALYYLNEGERIGREGGGMGDLVRDVHMGVRALLERVAREEQEPGPDPSLIPFRPPAKRPPPSADGAAAPPGLMVADAKMVRDYCKAASGGNTQLANAAYARVIDDATAGGKLNSRWQVMAEDTIEKVREGGGNPDAPGPEDDPLFADTGEVDTDELWDDGR